MARIQGSEVPPEPPVIQTLVAEVYGPDLDGQTRVAGQIKSIFQNTPGVVDTDWYVEDPQPRLAIRVDEANLLSFTHAGEYTGIALDDPMRCDQN
jgi:multidrug efflux pump subunit AcrB